MARGQCNCGAVSFTIDAPLSDVFICHCSICRRWSGANGVAVVIAPRSAFHWLSGEKHIASWAKPDADWRSWFCQICGSALPGENDASHMFIPAGLLTSDTAALRVAHHIWVGSKACWDEIGDDGRRHVEGYKA